MSSDFFQSKLLITGIFSFGVFVVSHVYVKIISGRANDLLQIISATLSRYYCFAQPESILWIFWYVREASTAVIVANIPHLYALLRSVFNLEAFGSLVKRTTNRTRHNQYPLDSNSDANGRPNGRLRFGSSKNRSESTENLGPEHDVSLQIWQRNEYDVKTNKADQWDTNEAQTIMNGGIGTKSTVVSNASRLSRDTD